MAQILTTELPALTTKSSGVLSLIDDSVCATCGGDLVMDSDNPTVTFCGKCYAVDLAPTRATLAAAAWAKAAGHEVDEISVSEWTDEGNETPPSLTMPGRYWYIDLSVVDGVCAARCPLYVIEQADGSMHVVPDDFPTCQHQESSCSSYILTDATGTRRCPEHGEVTAWNIPVSFYADEDGPATMAQDAADFARIGTVQWFDDYPDDDDAERQDA